MDGPVFRLRSEHLQERGLHAKVHRTDGIALDASVTHMYAPGVRRHIQAALRAGATPEEIMAVLQVCVSLGVQACAHAVPILAEELERKNA